jgi:hypothetical protein
VSFGQPLDDPDRDSSKIQKSTDYPITALNLARTSVSSAGLTRPSALLCALANGGRPTPVHAAQGSTHC